MTLGCQPSVCPRGISNGTVARGALGGAFCARIQSFARLSDGRSYTGLMNRVPAPVDERDEHSRDEGHETDGDVRAKIRREHVAEAQEKILATYAETFRRLAE